MRWPVPLIFALVGPSAGAVAALVVLLVGNLAGGGLPRAVLRHFGELAIGALLISWPLGAVQAFLVGLVAARSLRRGGPVTAGPVLLAALVLVIPSAAVLALLPPLGRVLPFGEVVLLTLVAHLAGAGAALLAVRLARRHVH